MYRSVQGPFPIHRLGNDIFGNADAADAPGMHTVESEFGPEPIDDEAAERFVRRWKSIAVHAEPLQWRCASPPNRNNRPPVARLFRGGAFSSVSLRSFPRAPSRGAFLLRIYAPLCALSNLRISDLNFPTPILTHAPLYWHEIIEAAAGALRRSCMAECDLCNCAERTNRLVVASRQTVRRAFARPDSSTPLLS